MSFSRSFPFGISSLALLASCAGLRAATPASPPAGHSHTPASSAHAPGPITLDEFVTSAAPFSRNQVDLAQSTTVLSGRSLLLKQQATLGETLAGEAGMTATSFGQGASRPIIRGLGGDRIRLLENSVGTIDASVASPDHAVSVEPFLVERIEVVRGPASLLYGSNAVGGVVNVITHRIETDLPEEPLRGAFEVRGGSAADEFARGGVIDFALKTAAQRALVFHVDGFRRTAKDVRIPGFAESAQLRQADAEEAAEHGEPAPAFAHGRLPNSALETESGAAGVSFVSAHFHVGASYSGFNSDYGVPGHAHEHDGESAENGGVRIALRQRRTDIQGEWHGRGQFVNGARFKLGQARYQHQEFEPDGVEGSRFTNKGHEARLEVLHGGDDLWSGALGAQVTRSDFGASGEEAFLPPSRTDTAALFAFEEVGTGPLVGQFGARYERTKISTPGFSPRRADEVSGSVGAVWKFHHDYALAMAVTHTGRPPNAQELFANGPHAGTQAFEIGARDLRAERALGAEISLRRRAGFVTGAVTAFTNRFDGFIFEEPTGELAVEQDGAWVLVGGDDDAAAEGLPVFQYVQRDARFWGAEIETLWHVHEKTGWQLDLRLAADLTRAQEGGRPLPRIPAARIMTGFVWTRSVWNAGVECQFVDSQERVAANETRSDSYELVNAHVTRTFEIGHWHGEVFLRGSNLTNAEARPHTSFVKELAPLPGRNVVAGVRFAF